MFTKEYWVSSLQKLSSTTYLALIAIFIAMKTIVSIWYIPVSDNLRIAFTFIIVAVESCIVGPIAGVFSGAITDIVSFMIAPSGPFFLGYTLSSMLGSFIYALFFYRTTITLPKIIFAKGFVNYGVNVLLGSLWSMMLYSKGFIYYASKSIIKNTLLLPIEVIALYFVFKYKTP
ncbi:MAG: folate family ECF transporter S component, partial [Solobacterium sp.]|nr:folate family ECF transporter S component [Solobacterium sp.]